MTTKKKSETPTLNLDWLKSPVTTDNQSKSGIIEDKPKKRRPNLKSLCGVRRYLARCVRLVEQGAMDPRTANSITYMLSTMTKVIELEQLEKKLSALEKEVKRKISNDNVVPMRRVK